MWLADGCWTSLLAINVRRAWFWAIERYTWLDDGTGDGFPIQALHTFESPKPQLPTPIEAPPSPPPSEINLLNRRRLD